jgi:DNA-3-methyladenine glycosylase II
MADISTSTITPRGPFSLRAAAEFGFGPTTGAAPDFDGSMRLAFAVDGGAGYAGAVLRQPEAGGPVEIAQLELRGGASADDALRQVARVVSLDHDGEEFMKVGRRDHVIGELQRRHPGQRPVLFHSPYEAAAWAIISARRPARQAAATRASIAHEHGETFEDLAGRTLLAFPTPDRLAELPADTLGLNAAKVERLRGIAHAALDGQLDVEHLQQLGPERATEHVQRLKGIGPFYAGLIVVRGTGFTDALLQTPEPRLLKRAGELYGLAQPMTLEQLTAHAEAWRPFRTWATVLVRLAGDRAARGPERR